MGHPLEAPIPGQSLTSEPKNVPWEYPARITDPMDALEFHMQQLTDENTVDNIMEMLEVGIPISVVASSMLTIAVMDGEHSLDVKLIIKPLVENHIKSLAEAASAFASTSATIPLPLAIPPLIYFALIFANAAIDFLVFCISYKFSKPSVLVT